MNPPADAVARRIFDMELQGSSILDVTKALNAEGVASPRGKKWLKTTIHNVLLNEAYTGTLNCVYASGNLHALVPRFPIGLIGVGPCTSTITGRGRLH